MYKYRTDAFGGLYRKDGFNAAQSFDFKNKDWHYSDYAEDLFFSGKESLQISKEEAINILKKQGLVFDDFDLLKEDLSEDLNQSQEKIDRILEYKLTKEKLDKFDKSKICGLMFAETGAMGCPGEITLLIDEGPIVSAYHTETLIKDYSDVYQSDVTKLFDGFEFVPGFMALDHTELTINDQKWIYLNLEFGNHLYLKNEILKMFKIDLIGKYQSERYVFWKNMLKKVYVV